MTNNIKNYKIYAPCFSGFYQGVHDSDGYIEYILEDIKKGEYDIAPEDKGLDDFEIYDKYFDFDFDNYKNEYSKLFLDFTNDFIFYSDIKKDLGIEGLLEFEGVSSPTYYNYDTDKIKTNINIDINIMIKYLIKNKQEFSKYILNQNTSYDGYCSFISNDFNGYLLEIKQGDHIQAIILQVLEYYILNVKDVFSDNNLIDDFLTEKGSDIIELFYNNNTFNNKK